MLGSGALEFGGGSIGSDGATARTVSNALLFDGAEAKFGTTNSGRTGMLTFTGAGTIAADTSFFSGYQPHELSGALGGPGKLTKTGVVQIPSLGEWRCSRGR